MIKILVLGINPSWSSPDCSAFHEATRSRQTLDDWFHKADIGLDCRDIDMKFWNLSDKKGDSAPKYKWVESRISMIDIIQDQPKIIAVGKIVSEYLKKYKKKYPLCKFEWIEVYHPSGLNRKLNNPDEVKKTIDSIRKFIRGKHEQR